jgi:phage repressor protein C with HTH and peptisase S24 domain/transcriptional regulator with XRE-family HTH domain
MGNQYGRAGPDCQEKLSTLFPFGNYAYVTVRSEEAAFRKRFIDAVGAMERKRLAEESGVSEATISRLVTGNDWREPGLFKVKRLAEAAGTTVGALLGEVPAPPFGLVERTRARQMVGWLTEMFHLVGDGVSAKTYNVEPPTRENVVAMPERTRPRWTPEFPIDPRDFSDGGDTDYPLELHGVEQEDIDAAAGWAGIENDDMTTLLNSREVRDNKIRTVRVRGDSMAPTFEDGWKLAVDVTKRDPQNGDAVIVYRHGHGTIVARWLSNGSDVWLMKDNEEEDSSGNRIFPDVEMRDGDALVGIVAFVAWQPVRRLSAMTLRMPRKRKAQE